MRVLLIQVSPIFHALNTILIFQVVSLTFIWSKSWLIPPVAVARRIDRAVLAMEAALKNEVPAKEEETKEAAGVVKKWCSKSLPFCRDSSATLPKRKPNCSVDSPIPALSK